MPFAQVEQPFQILPLWQLCHIATLAVEEAISSPMLPLPIKSSAAVPYPTGNNPSSPGLPFEDVEYLD